MGFNNAGRHAAARRLRRTRGVPVVVGVNIGKTKVVPESEAVADYVASARKLAPLADYLVVNVSSPNTPGLRDLQAVALLRPLLDGGQGGRRRHPRPHPAARQDRSRPGGRGRRRRRRPGPGARARRHHRDQHHDQPGGRTSGETGGLSGRPLKARSLEVLRRLRARVGDRIVLVSVGGVEDVDDVWERLLAGATLVQGYTG